jgi:hypothetical protein
MEEEKWGVHIGHCCVHHGCKYMNDDCPVVNMLADQKYPCEYCCEIEEKAVEFKESNEGKELFRRLRVLAIANTNCWQEEEYKYQQAETLFEDFIKAVYGPYWKKRSEK